MIRIAGMIPIALVTVLAGCAGVITERSGTATIDKTFNVTGFRWQGGGTVYVFVAAREKGGQTEVCAAWSPEKMDAYSSRLNDQAIDTISLVSEGDTLVKGGWFMNYLRDPNSADGKQANCVLSETPWKAPYAKGVRVRVSRARFIY